MISNKLGNKAFRAVIWSALDRIFLTFFVFFIGIILARLLSPREFGLIGIVTFFIAISSQLIDGGFTQAIIRKDKATQTDYSTIFFFNIIIALFLYFILYLLAEDISIFFGESDLNLIIKYLGLILIFHSLGIVQQAKLTRKIDFKSQMKVSIFSSTFSGFLGLYLAYTGHGIWSLVWMQLSNRILMTLLLWVIIRWIPSIQFSFKSFNEMFSFGYKMMLSSLIYSINRNFHLFIIGKYISPTELGYYTRAEKFNQAPSEGLSAVIERVSYPTLSSIKDDSSKLSLAYKRIIKSSMFVTFPLMITLAFISNNLILTLIGSQWTPAIPYLQLLCFLGMLVPLHVSNLNLLKVVGRSDLFLKLEILKAFLSLPAFAVCLYIGVQEFIIAMIITSFLVFFLNSHLSGKYIEYSSFNQIYDLLPMFLVSILVGYVAFVSGNLLENNFHLEVQVVLLIQVLLVFILYLIINEILRFDDYLFIKRKIKQSISND